MTVPPQRIWDQDTGSPRSGGRYVLYWMTAFRRRRYNFALDRALEHAKRFSKPLLVLEALRVDYPWASDRFHGFVLEGMRANAHAFERAGVRYYPYVERGPGEGDGLLQALARHACVVVTDDYPCFFLPTVLRAARRTLRPLGVALEAIDSNGLYPMRATDRVFARAVDFRRHLQRTLAAHLEQFPRSRPLKRYAFGMARVPSEVSQRWPAARGTMLNGDELEQLPIDHAVARVRAAGDTLGGAPAAQRTLRAFLSSHLSSYDEDRNHPDASATSGLSKFLHFGHISAHEVFEALTREFDFSTQQLSSRANGSREGFWGLPKSAEAFLDQLVTWRELGFNCCALRRDYDRYSSLPGWARDTLEQHASDPRPQLYSREQFESGATHDGLWNAAQRQLVLEGELHNYLRMLWGKKILEWSASPEEALEHMIDLNNKYAIDGRDPSSYSGIFWVLGRYDRAWGPERAVFGKIRYMSSDNTVRKLRLRNYLERYGEPGQKSLF